MIDINEWITKEKDGISVDLENIGEGVCGDYNENNPYDFNLLRFSVYIDGEEVDDASYCTNIEATEDDEVLYKALEYIFNRYYYVLHSDPYASVKKMGEELSWLSGYDFKPREEN